MFDPKFQQLVGLLHIFSNKIHQAQAFIPIVATYGIGIVAIPHTTTHQKKKKSMKMSHAHIIICDNEIIIEPTKQVKTSEKKKTLFIS